MTGRRENTSRRSQRVPAISENLGPASRWRPSVPLLAAGGVSVVVGGLIAAVTGPTGWEQGSWVAAFVVLVAGVAQVGLGVGQAQFTAASRSVGFAAAECVLWNAGCLLVVTGTLLSSPVVVSVGAAPLVAVLAMSTVAVRGRARQSRLALAYRALLIVLLVSVPVGIALAWARS